MYPADPPVDRPDSGWLLVDSRPAGVPVMIDGQEAGETPLLLPRTAGPLSLQVGGEEQAVELATGQLLVLTVSLQEDLVRLGPATPLEWDGIGGPVESAELLRPGAYLIERRGPEQFVIVPVYPGEGRYRGLTAGLAAALAGTLAAGAMEVGLAIETPTSVPLMAAGGLAAGSVLGILRWREAHRRQQFLSEFEVPAGDETLLRVTLLQEGQEAFERGESAYARELLGRLIDDYPASPETSEALLILGRQALLRGDRDEARVLLERLLYEVPRPRFLAEAAVRLIDLALAREDRAAARAVLRRTPILTDSPLAGELRALREELVSEE